MIEFAVEPSLLPQMSEGIAPTHKIIVKQGAETSVFWYLQHSNPCGADDPPLDKGMVRQLHTEAQRLLVGDFLYFSCSQGCDYHLQRLGQNRFILKALNQAGVG